MAGAEVTIQLQQLTIGLIVFGLALLGFGTWFVRSYWPKQLESRRLADDEARKQALEKSDNEIQHQRAIYEVDLAQRRQEVEVQNQILNGFLESSRNFVKLSERNLDYSEKMAGELYGHRQVLGDVSETIDKIHADFEGLKTQIEAIALSVQNSTISNNAVVSATSANTTIVNQMLQSIQAFGAKLDSYASAANAAKGDTGKIPVMQPISND